GAEAPAAKPLIRQLPRPVGIALAGRDRIAHPGDEHITHCDLADEPQRGAVRQHNIDARQRWPAADEARPDFLVASGVDLPRMTVAVVEAPHASFICRQGSTQRDAHAVIVRRQIVLAFAIARAKFQQPAGPIDAQAIDRVAGPAAAIALLCPAPALRETAFGAGCIYRG